MPQVIRIVAALKLQQTLGNRSGRIGNFIIFRFAIDKLLMDLLYNIRHGVAFTDEAGLHEMFLKA
ncbi:hypothetical protein ES703_66304 [subsurface metagenome]